MATTEDSVTQPTFLDTNLLLRSTVATAPQHDECRRALEHLWDNNADLWISHQVLREYMTNVTRPQTFMQPMDRNAVIERIRYFKTRFNVAEETHKVNEQLLKLVETIPIGGKQIHDANLAATMMVYNIPRLLTLNPVDFRRFSAYITVLTVADVLPTG